MGRFRRSIVRHERRANIHLAFPILATAFICLGEIRRFWSVFFK